MCKARATGKEHAPPKCFFPEKKDLKAQGLDLRQNLITVPSCDAHNTSRSKDDEYAMVITVTHFETNRLARHHFGTKVIRALRRSRAFTQAVFHKAREVRLGRQKTGLVEVDLDRFYRVMEHTCRALIFHEYNRQLPAELHTWSPAFRYPTGQVDMNEAALAFQVRQVLKSKPKRGQNPDAFCYQLYHEAERPFTAVRLIFYGGFHVYAVSLPSRRGAA